MEQWLAELPVSPLSVEGPGSRPSRSGVCTSAKIAAAYVPRSSNSFLHFITIKCLFVNFGHRF